MCIWALYFFLYLILIQFQPVSLSLSLHEKNYVPRIFIYYVHICTCGRGSVTGSDKRVDTFGLLDVDVSCCMVVGGSECVCVSAELKSSSHRAPIPERHPCPINQPSIEYLKSPEKLTSAQSNLALAPALSSWAQ